MIIKNVSIVSIIRANFIFIMVDGYAELGSELGGVPYINDKEWDEKVNHAIHASVLDSYDIYNIVDKYGVAAIDNLQKEGADFFKLETWYTAKILNKYYLEGLKPLLAVKGSNYRYLAEARAMQWICYDREDVVASKESYLIKDQFDLPFGYYLLQTELPLWERNFIISLDIDKLMPNNTTALSGGMLSYYGKLDGQASAYVITGGDNNGALITEIVDTLYKKHVNVLHKDWRNFAPEDLPVNDFLETHEVNATNIDMVWIEMHGTYSSGHHQLIIEEGHNVLTNAYIYKLHKFFAEKPFKVVLTSCSGSLALRESIIMLPVGSEIVALSRATPEGDYHMRSSWSEKLRTQIDGHSRFDVKDPHVIKSIAVLASYIGARPTYIVKNEDNTSHEIACLSEAEIDGVAPEVLMGFYATLCGREDYKCENIIKNDSNATQGLLRAFGCYRALVL
ncbi:MAG: hypothetical protein ACHP9Y_03975 [Gammaproteobacteria bacterium]